MKVTIDTLIKIYIIVTVVFTVGFYLIGVSMTTLSQEPKQNLRLVKKIAAEVFADKPIIAQLCLAQAILESRLRSKPSDLAFKYNNLFGIKGQGTRGRVVMQTQEQSSSGKKSTIKGGFAYNESIEDSVKQYRKLLEKGTSDKPDRYKKVLDAKTFEEAATEIRKAGYATDISYTKLLLQVYESTVKNL